MSLLQTMAERLVKGCVEAPGWFVVTLSLDAGHRFADSQAGAGDYHWPSHW
jgi:hypothetical protein